LDAALNMAGHEGNHVVERIYFHSCEYTAWWQKNSYPCMSFCMSFCLVGYEFFCHQAVAGITIVIIYVSRDVAGGAAAGGSYKDGQKLKVRRLEM